MAFAFQNLKQARPPHEKHVLKPAPRIMRQPADPDIHRKNGGRCACGGSCPRCQAKPMPRISEPGDAYEREADAVADRVMRMTGGELPIMRKAVAGQSCESAPAQEEEEESQIMRSPLAGVAQPEPDLAAGFAETRTSGSPLPDGVRSFMESRIGADFGDVRLHTDARAARMAEALNAAAFTSGRDIYFQPAYYSPDTSAGRKLLAHELTHVVQQGAGHASPDISSDGGAAPIQRYELNGFPKDKASQMDSAIASAKTTVAMCDYLTWIGQHDIATALDRSRYDYVPDLGMCGWTFPSSWYIEVGDSAFDQKKCCSLASTLAHEAAHVMWRTEGGAREMECECFGCSC